MENKDFTTHYSGIEGNFTCLNHRACPFCRCIQIINPMENNDFTTHYSGIEGNFTCLNHRACLHERE